MLEVGRVEAPGAPATFLTWNRAHFVSHQRTYLYTACGWHLTATAFAQGAWCVVSSPLVLGLELTDEKLEPILDVIGNSEAIAVNQAWAGHPGRLVQSWAGPAIELKPPPAASLNTRQLWAKPVGEGAVAVLLINASPHELEGFTLKLSALNISQPSAVRSSSSLAHAGG